jgi:hypothetical protein
MTMSPDCQQESTFDDDENSKTLNRRGAHKRQLEEMIDGDQCSLPERKKFTGQSVGKMQNRVDLVDLSGDGDEGQSEDQLSDITDDEDEMLTDGESPQFRAGGKDARDSTVRTAGSDQE